MAIAFLYLPSERAISRAMSRSGRDGLPGVEILLTRLYTKGTGYVSLPYLLVARRLMSCARCVFDIHNADIGLVEYGIPDQAL